MNLYVGGVPIGADVGNRARNAAPFDPVADIVLFEVGHIVLAVEAVALRALTAVIGVAHS